MSEAPAQNAVGFEEEALPHLDAVYRFALLSDDGSRLAVAGSVVVDNDGLHGAEERTGVIPLAAGWHPLSVEYFNKTGGAELQLRCGPLGTEPAPLEPERLGTSHP